MVLPKLDKQEKQRIALSIVGVLFLAFVYYQYFMKPTWRKINQNRAKIIELTQKLNELKKMSVRIEALKAETQAVETNWRSLETKLPKSRDLPKILDTIATLAEKNKIELNSISPQGVKSDAPLYSEYSFGLSISGSYHDIALFLTELGHAQRLFHSKDLNLSARQAPAINPEANVNATLTVVAFEYKGS